MAWLQDRAGEQLWSGQKIDTHLRAALSSRQYARGSTTNAASASMRLAAAMHPSCWKPPPPSPPHLASGPSSANLQGQQQAWIPQLVFMAAPKAGAVSMQLAQNRPS